jgi:preprotein translocase subunit YajC
VSFLIVMVLLLVVMYVLMIRPQRQRQQQHQRTIDTCGVGDDVLTTGGIYGTITEAEGDDLVVEIADGLSVHMTRRGIAAVLPPEEDEDDEDLEDEADLADVDIDDEPRVVESPVAEREEPVTSQAGADADASDRR